MLTERQTAILDFIIGQYISSATPVASSTIVQRKVLSVSPATVRNEMADLEEGGYITRRHISGGGIPSDKGYRFYIESIPPQRTLSDDEEQEIRTKFEEVKADFELGTKTLTDILSALVRNVAMTTFPKAIHTRIRRLDLVALQEASVLVVLVLHEARTRQRVVQVPALVTQDELTLAANRLTAAFGGATRDGLAFQPSDLSAVERQVLGVTSDILLEEDTRQFDEPHLSGLRHLLHQPEFTQSARVRDLVDVLADRDFIRKNLPDLMKGEQFRVVIGDENGEETMQECSVLLSRYGSADGIGGLIAVIGPTRMEYRRSIGSVRLLSDLMTEMVWQLR